MHVLTRLRRWRGGRLLAVLVAAAVATAAAGDAAGDAGRGLPFRDTFRPKPDAGWRWVREDPKAWRVGEGGLEVRVQPGNMWGPANDARNVLLRPLPDGAADQGVRITAAVEHRPTAQYEQVDLVWYYDDAHMVKLGQEMVDGRLSVVMGREQADTIRTIKIVPLDSHRLELQMDVRGGRAFGRFRTPGGEWREVGDCELPAAPGDAEPQVSLQFYQGPADAEHWARVSELKIEAAAQ